MDRNEFRDRVLAVLDRFELTEADFTILNHLHYCDRPKQALLVHASGANYSLGTDISQRQTSAAVRRLTQGGILREVSARDIRRIAHDLRRARVLGPVYRLPNPGSVQYTIEGAEIGKAISSAMKSCRPWPLAGFAFLDVIEERTRWYFATRRAAEKKHRELARWKDVHEVTAIEEMDRFQIQPWWNLRSGWRFDSVQRFRWQGRGGGSQQPRVHWSRPAITIDRPRLRRTLSRCNLDVAAWCMLLTVAESGACSHRLICQWAAWLARRLYRTPNADERVQIAFHKLYSSRRIQLVDERTRQPIPIEAMRDPNDADRRFESNHIDIALYGARLVHELGPVIYGKNWLDSWSVECQVYRKEHRYGKTLNDIAAAIEEYDGIDAPVISIGPVTAIGPWCLHWWERFDEGCRIEVEIGETPTAFPQSIQGR